MEVYLYAIWHPPVTLRLVFSLGVGMKGYLYTILASSSNPEVNIFFRCRNEGIPVYYIGISSNPEVGIFFRCRNEGISLYCIGILQ
jgi:hypothetical protein